jgi:hypothetical protein
MSEENQGTTPSQAPVMSLEPNKIDQTVTGPKGNCQSACLAMILGLPISSVPNFFDGLELDDPDLSEKWHQAERRWLESLGWASITLNVEGGFFEKHFSKGFVIASGQSIRGMSHAVVYKDGKLWHDPFAGGQGVNAVREVEVVYPLRPFPIMSLQAEVERLRSENQISWRALHNIMRWSEDDDGDPGWLASVALRAIEKARRPK